MEWCKLKQGERLRKTNTWTQNTIEQIETVLVKKIEKKETIKEVVIELDDERKLRINSEKFLWENTTEERYFHNSDTTLLEKNLSDSFVKAVVELKENDKRLKATISKITTILITKYLKIRRG